MVAIRYFKFWGERIAVLEMRGLAVRSVRVNIRDAIADVFREAGR